MRLRGDIPVTRGKGSMLMEAVVCLPVLLVLILGCMQIAHIWFARQMVQYAAYAAARSLLVVSNPDHKKAVEPGGVAWKAAAQVCAWVALSGHGHQIGVPGWGEISGSGSMEEKLKLSLDQPYGEWYPGVTVQFDFPLVMPIAGPLIGWGVNPWKKGREWSKQHADMTDNRHRSEAMRYPYIRFKESAAFPKPYMLPPFQTAEK